MNRLIQKEGYFLCFILNARNKKQIKCLLETITKQQLRALVEIIYNVLHGYDAPEYTRNLNKHKIVLRTLISKTLSRKERIRLMIKHFATISKLLVNIKQHIFVQWRKN